MAAAIDRSLVKLEVVDGNVYITPTEELVKLTQDRVAQYSKQTF